MFSIQPSQKRMYPKNTVETQENNRTIQEYSPPQTKKPSLSPILLVENNETPIRLRKKSSENTTLINPAIHNAPSASHVAQLQEGVEGLRTLITSMHNTRCQSEAYAKLSPYEQNEYNKNFARDLTTFIKQQNDKTQEGFSSIRSGFCFKFEPLPGLDME